MENDQYMKSFVADNMRILKNVPVPMSDGIILRADVFMPVEKGSYPAIMSHGLYGKNQRFQDHYKGQWDIMVKDFPGIAEGTTNKYQNWETADPEKFVPHGYAVVRVDSRGSGWSEGIQKPWSAQENQDYYEAIEWVGTQEWCDGNVALLGISYYGANQWPVAAMQPPHLKAIIPWEGTSDWYREFYYHGGIRSTFVDSWSEKQKNIQYGVGENGRKNSLTGEWVAGPVTLSEEELAENKVDIVKLVKDHPLDDGFYDDIKVDFSKINIPILSSANWGGAGLHLRGNIEGFLEAASDDKWLEVHGYEHWTHFYTPYGVDLQLRFLNYFLKNEANGWEKEPRVRIQTRQINNEFTEKHYNKWPLENTNWEKYYLNTEELKLEKENIPTENHQASYEPFENELSFKFPKFNSDYEFTGPVAAKLFVASETEDADLFLTLRLFDQENKEVPFRGAMDAHAPVAQGWLRASHRKLDQEKSLPYRPYHTHDEKQPLVPGEIYELAIEIWPTSIVIPKGYQFVLTVGGKDFEFSGEVNEESKKYHRYPSLGNGPFLHEDRSEEVYGGTVTLHSGPDNPSYILMPSINN